MTLPGKRRFVLVLVVVLGAAVNVAVLLKRPQDIFAAVVAVSTVCYVLLTWNLVEETRELRRLETEPQVSVYAEPSPRAFIFFDLVIANIGRGPAYYVRLSLDGEEWVIHERGKLSE